MENVILDPNLIFAAGEKIINEKIQIYKEISNIIIQEIITLTQFNKFLISKVENSNNYKYEYMIKMNKIKNEKYVITNNVIKEVKNYIINNNINTQYKNFNISPSSINDNSIIIEFELEDPKTPHIK